MVVIRPTSFQSRWSDSTDSFCFHQTAYAALCQIGISTGSVTSPRSQDCLRNVIAVPGQCNRQPRAMSAEDEMNSPNEMGKTPGGGLTAEDDWL